MRHAILLIAFAAVCFAQQGNNVKISQAPADEAFTVINHFTSSNLDYSCKARSTQDVKTITVSAISNANPGVMTATAHGFYFATNVTQKIVVFISGLTGNWTPLNGAHVLTPTGANTLQTDVDTTTFGAVTGTPVVSTRAPRTTDSVWSVYVNVYDATNNLTITAWPVTTTAATLGALQGGTSAFKFQCAMPSAYE